MVAALATPVALVTVSSASEEGQDAERKGEKSPTGSVPGGATTPESG